MKANHRMRSRYSDEFMIRAVAMIEACGSVTEVSRQLGIARSILYRWQDKARATSKPAATVVASAKEEAGQSSELRLLRRELARLTQENDILKKAAVILGSSAPGNPAG